jgi:putative transposase
MSHSYHKLWVHIIWGTKERFPALGKGIRGLLFDHIRENARQADIRLDAINGVSDHVHCLVELGLTGNVAAVVNSFKGASSHWINSQRLTPTHFAWQEGYAAFSVSASQVQRVRSYILNQEAHHAVRTYRDEVNALCAAHGIVTTP